MKTQNCKFCENSCIFNGIDTTQWLQNTNFKSGETIFTEDDSVNGLYVMKKGSAREFSSVDLVLNESTSQISNGDIFGHIDYRGEKHIRSAVAIENSEICLFTKEKLYDLCLSYTNLSLKLIKFFAAELSKSDQRTKVKYKA
ncbi:MAG: Crp/Fnr family transcriptional regulator [Flavobacteriales bacterium]|nr:Crp/Fnr family transcriptional regulator [Flavobacteriales bacterium]